MPEGVSVVQSTEPQSQQPNSGAAPQGVMDTYHRLTTHLIEALETNHKLRLEENNRKDGLILQLIAENLALERLAEGDGTVSDVVRLSYRVGN